MIGSDRKRLLIVTIGALGLSTASMSVATAQVQSPQQRACIVAFNKAAAKLAKAQVRTLTDCGRQRLEAGGSAVACLTADPTGRVQTARARMADTAASKCAVAPDFGKGETSAAIAAAAGEALGMISTLYASTGGLPEPTQAAESHCFSQMNRYFEKLLVAKLKAFFTCAHDGVFAGSITSSAELTSCLAATTAAQSEKIAAIVSRLAASAEKLCPLGSGLFECFEPDASSFSQCVDRVISCRSCALQRGVGGLGVDCDVQDDGAANGTCAGVCGNAVVETDMWGRVETCDDGNRVSGDGCDYNCTMSGCGNGVAAGTEYCDAFGGRCVGGANDGTPCWANAECGGGYCTSCPSGDCAADCGSCGAGGCCTGLGGCGLYEGYGQGCFLLGGVASCDSDTCQMAGTCCLASFGCMDSPGFIAECEGTLIGGSLIPCSQCPSCCAFDGYCTSWGVSDCLEYEGAPVDCSQCWPDSP